MSSIPTNVDVAIVGAGPAGLSTACVLRKQGVNAIVLDAAAEPSTASRATIIHSRTLEVMESIDLTDEIFAKGDKHTRWSICDRKNVLAELGFSKLHAKYPCVVTLPQSQTEGLLRQRLEELGGSVYQSARVTGIVEKDDGVELEVSECGSSAVQGPTKTVTAKYIVAADGLKSTIRSALNIPFEGGEYSASFITADCKLSSTGSLRADSIQLYLSPDGFLLFVPEPNGIWRIVATLDEAPKVANVELYQNICNARMGAAGNDLRIEELVWFSRFHIHHRLAGQYRKGRAFLAGDAAHVHSPAGGQGMNIGIQDGMRLGQILSEAVREGKDTAADLDRYEAERRPIAQGVVALTHRITVMATLKSPWLCWIRDVFIWGLMSVPAARNFMMYRIAELEH